MTDSMDDPIRVLHVADKFGVAGSSVAGVARLFTWWFPRFDHDRFRVRLAVLRGGDAAQREVERAGIVTDHLGKGKLDPSTVTSLHRLIRRHSIDVLHLHGYGASNFGRLAALITGVPSIVHEHFVDPAVPIYQRPWDFTLARVSSLNLAVSRSVRTFMVEERYLPPERVEVVMNGAPIEDFRPAPAKDRARERRALGVPDDHLVIGTVGRLDEQKGNTFLLNAAPHVLEQEDRVTFVLVGDGPLEGELRREARGLGIEDRVIFAGYRADVPLVQSTFDIQAFPSLWEGTPLTLFEAMAMSRTIVSTGVDGLGEVLEDRENALVVPARDSESLAHALLRLVRDADLRKRLAARAGEESERYDIRRTVEELETRYTRLVTRARKD